MKLKMPRVMYCLCGSALLFFTCLLAAGFLRAQEPPKAAPQKGWVPRSLLQNPGPPPKPLPEFVAAEKELKAIDELGPQLMKLLTDEKPPKDVWLYPLENRHAAAIWLGKLRYQPAIPMLIKYIETEGPAYDDGPTYPCTDALAKYGDAAVPALVDAFLSDDGRSGGREHCIYSSIAESSQPTARTYARGRAAENSDPEFKKRVEYFLNKIKPEVPR